MERKHVLVKGRVVGVGFRSFAKRMALEFGVRGFVRNLGEDVEIHAEGEKVGEFLNAINVQSTSFIGIHVEKIIEKKCGCETFQDFRIVF